MKNISHAKGTVINAFGNLLEVKCEGFIRQGEVAFVQIQDASLKAEVIEIKGVMAKLQVYEDTSGIQEGMDVIFTGDLLEAELGPGLLTSIYDGLQNPLEKVAEEAGFFLPRGLYLPALDYARKWDIEVVSKPGDHVQRGETLATTMEGRFTHSIMVPFSCYGKYTITWMIPNGAYTIDTVIAKAVDEEGKEYAWTMVQKWPIKASLFEGERIKPEKVMDTGLRTVDTLFPVMKGGTFCTPGPFGAGKTVLQHHLSKYSSVDIVIVCACGERAGEVVEVLREFPHLVDPHTGDALIERTVIICNTSSMPVAARESSIYMGATIGEYYRQMGLDVLLLADSTSRWAQALREMSGRLEEIPGEEAFPAYLSSRIAEFYERSGAIFLQDGKKGSLTIGGAVSPAGGNFEEPVTQATLAVVGAFLGLSRTRSDARRYPAIDPLISWTKYLTDVGMTLEELFPGWTKMVSHAHTLLFQGDEIGKRMEVVGEEGTAIDELVIYLKAELFDFCYLQQNAFDKEDAYCSLQRQMSLFSLMNTIFQQETHFLSHDEARKFFISIQSKIKNLNFMPYLSDPYKVMLGEVEEMIVSQEGAAL